MTPWITQPVPFNIGQGAAAGGGVLAWSWESDLSSSDGWATSDATAISVDTGNEVITWTVSRGTNDSIVFDLETFMGEAVSDEEWVLRFKTSWSDLNLPSGSAENQQWVGISSVDESGSHSTNQYFIGFMTAFWTYNPATSKSLRSIESYNTGLDNHGDYEAVVSRSIDTYYFYEIKRTSTTEFELSVSSTDAYEKDIVSAQTITILDTLVNLRYVKLVNENAGSGADGTASVTASFQFINDSSTPP